ncbi:hypothetical protein [Marinilactibacillus sp. Marseille-P9653]|uniref:hypothetical protein n=1 Tax=Marinilactibacillus sp. Marseille-P9653 TaxID=2866583 RepID=UPI001CE46CB5|nr:hypothetical protein [Marinilactibacillus sp. Marseille-P9653]
MEKISSALKGLFLIFVAFILTIIGYLLFGYIQRIVLVPDDFLLWTVNFSVNTVVVIVELALIIGLYYLFHKPFRDHIKSVLLKITFVEKFRKPIIRSIIAIILFCFYSMITAVTVITPDKIIDHSFLHPLGREFTYKDVVKIDAKVKGERFLIPFSYSEGEFFYVNFKFKLVT